ncbi:hypothetical protein [Perlabentimonas gracilis]|uniref:hypothetical protein n=1 Tax=Perlabentimonas gracilis TaxID=2715279 RepID=UPI00140B918F|nr:hypothetical protein [Perlabentimonas gracilis]NHB67296.1 hypothetical protein [Perlabentimonas gracilis]
MRSLIIILLTGVFFFSSFSGSAQCKNYAKRVCRLELAPYIHDGNYNAAILTEGEDAELFKTFYAGQEYRIAVCGSEPLSKVEFQVLDVERTILYTNANHNFKLTWDFKVESTQQLIILVKVHDIPGEGEIVSSGCVAIMFGLKTD